MSSTMTDGKTIILRIEIDTNLASSDVRQLRIVQAKGDIIAIDVIHTDKNKSLRDLTVKISEQGAAERLTEALKLA